MNCNGQFTITGWDENILSEKREGVKQTHASITQAYEGSMAGQSDVEFLMSYQTSMLAQFVGFESFVGVIDGRRGTISFKHDGKFENGVASSSFSAIEGSATGELSDCVITGVFESAENGKANYSINIAE
ncbi:DUF3224 domain-containing protein [Alteromonas sp. 1_MG-2023]|uniref:DUF3224 domain-containing protein n=1 Tax=Alteromonas sp. 1_MG-2023 TaxID=3062669 RepID=UPI0026E24C2C|nr:DUF3224 domain-containing protein [Alteromonas sp. 1_MG-2023]MDO6568779.1 DUF3224 domain-containing protein [Alteromonas sp. 1_MG-2023]